MLQLIDTKKCVQVHAHWAMKRLDMPCCAQTRRCLCCRHTAGAEPGASGADAVGVSGPGGGHGGGGLRGARGRLSCWGPGLPWRRFVGGSIRTLFLDLVQLMGAGWDRFPPCTHIIGVLF